MPRGKWDALRPNMPLIALYHTVRSSHRFHPDRDLVEPVNGNWSVPWLWYATMSGRSPASA